MRMTITCFLFDANKEHFFLQFHRFYMQFFIFFIQKIFAFLEKPAELLRSVRKIAVASL